MAKKSSSVSKAVKPTNKKVSKSKVSLGPTPIKKVSKPKGVKASSQKKQSAVLQPQSIENLQAQLTQREAELAIINSIQQGLAAELDFQAIVDLVGDKLREVFNTPDLGITWYDEKANLVNYLYMFEHGVRLSVPPTPPRPDGIYETEIKTRKPVILNNPIDYANINMATMPGTDASKSYVSVPIISSDCYLGSLNMENFERENAYGESELRLLTTIAASLGTALENARLFDETQRLLKITEERNAELAIINSVQAALAAELNIQGIYDAVGDKIREIFHNTDMGIRIHDPKTNLIHYPYTYENGERVTIESRPREEIGFTGYILRTRETLVINENVEEESQKYGSYILDDTAASKSELFVPLIVGDQARGLINLSDLQREHAFSESDVRLLQTLANSMSVALENARLFDETQRLLKITEDRAAELAIINSVQQGLASKLDVEAIFELVGEQLRDIFHAQHIVVAYVPPKTSYVEFKYVHGENGRIYDPPHPIGPIEQYWIDTRQPLVWNSVEEMRLLPADVWGALTPAGEALPRQKSFAGVAIFAGDEIRGGVALQNLKHENAYSDTDVRLLQTLCNAMSVALENAILFDETQRLLNETEQHNAELAIINGASQVLTQELDLQSLVDMVGDKLRAAIQAKNIGIGLYNKDTGLLDSVYVYKNDRRLYPNSIPLNTFSLRFARQGKSLVLNEVTDETWAKFGSNLTFGKTIPKSVIMIPILTGGELIGGITVQDFKISNAFPDSMVRLLETIASNMGTAIQNARLFDETQRLLQETEQRAQELAIINRVGEAMSQQLDVQTITRTVGDKVTEIFHADATSILMLNEKNSMILPIFEWDEGKYIENVEAFPLGTGLTSRVIQTRQPLILGTAEEAAAYGAYYPPEAADVNPTVTQSYLGVPIIVGEKVIGVISVHTYSTSAYDQNSVRLLFTLANNMGVALENARLFDETNRLLKETEQRAVELTVINKIQEGLVAELNPQAMYELVGNRIHELFPKQGVVLSSYDHSLRQTNYHYVMDAGRQIQPEPTPFSYISEELVRTRKPLLLNQGVEELERKNVKLIKGTSQSKSVLFVPLMVGELVQGVIQIADDNLENFFTNADVRLLATVSTSLSVALQNARLFNETQRRNAELAILNGVGKIMAQILDVKSLTRNVGDKVREIFNAEIADILLYDQKTNIVQLTYSYSDGYFDNEPPWELGEGLTSKIILSRRPLLLKSAKEIDENGAESYLTAPTENDDVRSYLGVPIMIGDQILGVVDVQSFRAKAFDENNLRLLQTITSNIGVALENARLFDETQRLLNETEKRAQELSIINKVQADLSASMEMQSMYNMVGDKLREVFDAQVVTIIDYDPKINRNYWRYAVEKGEALNIQPRAPFGFSKYIIETHQMILVNDNLAERRRELGGGVAAGRPAKSYLGVPLLINNQVRGVISLQNVDRENAFSESDVRLLQTLANSMSVTLENARLFDETQHRERETSALLNISRDISASLEVSTVLEGIATHAKNLLNGNVSALFLPQGDGSTFRATTAVGEDAENILNDTINVGEGILGNIAENKFGEIVNDVNNDPRAITIAGTDTSPNEHLLAVPLMANNELKGLMAVWRTSTDAEFLQTELEFLNGLARQAVIAVQNAQLFTEAQELRISAEQANIAKSAFMSNMSHELRTPLNAIIGFTRIVRRKAEGLLPEKQTENLDKVLTSADHLLGLINTVLDIAKIEARRMDVQAANFPIHSLADQCANLATPLLKPAVTLEKQMGENIGLMYSDQEKIKQIVLNLLSNAAKFTHEGKIVLSVNRADSNVNISVTDSGIGISEEALSRVFEEFQQADTSTTRQYGGTGLGLSISRNLAHLLGGELTVTSEFGKGSTFTLTLPIQYESKSDPSLNVKTDPVQKAEPHS